MNGYILKANGVELSTNDNVISLNYSINDILDISKRNTDFSKTITLVGDDVNNRFFSHYYDVNIDSLTFNPTIKIPATISVGINEIFNGHLQLISVLNNNQSISYEVVVAGNFKDFYTNLGNAVLSDLDMSEYNHIRNKANIQNSWEYQIEVNNSTVSVGTGGEGYVYPYIVQGDGISGIWNNVYVYNLYPAPYVRTIVNKLFQYAGYTVTSDFFDSEYFRKLIIPYTKHGIELSAEEFDARSVKIGVNNEYIDLTPVTSRGSAEYNNLTASYSLGGLTRESGTVTDGGSNYTFSDTNNQFSSDIFTAGDNGYYNINISGQLVPAVTHTGGKNDVQYSSGNFRYKWFLLKQNSNGSSNLLDSSVDANGNSYRSFTLSDTVHDCSGGQVGYYLDSLIPLNPSANNVFMQTGDKIVLNYVFEYSNDVNWVGLSDNQHEMQLKLKQSFDGNYTKYEVDPSSNLTQGNDVIDFKSVLSDKWKLKDFFSDLVKMFDLVIMANPNKENDLIVEPDEQFFNSKNKVLDWNNKLDNDSQIKYTPMSELDSRQFDFKYSNDDDFFNSLYAEETTKNYGDLSLTVQNDFSNKINTNQLSISPTPVAGRFIRDRVAPFFVESDEVNFFKAKNVNNRIIFYGGLVECEDWYIKDNINDSGTLLTSYPYCGMFDSPQNANFDLGFGRTDIIYWNTSTVPINSLFQMFHKSKFLNITDKNGRLMEAYFHLTPKDIKEFDFRDSIFLDSSYWRVNSIKDYSPIDGEILTKVTLYKLHEINVSNLASTEIRYLDSSGGVSPISSLPCPSDAVAYIDVQRPYYGSPSGQEFTQDCCNRIGGFWSENVCYVNAGTFVDYNRDNEGLNVDFGSSNGIPTIDNELSELFFDGNSINTPNIKVYGTNNYIPENAGLNFILGDNNSIDKNVINSIVVGSGIQATESNSLYLGDIIISQSGVTGLSISGGTDTYITGATYNKEIGILELNDSNLGTITITGFTTPPTIKHEVIEIGAWNMNSTEFLTVAHGLGSNWENITGIDVIVHNDAHTAKYPLNTAVSSNANGAVDYIDSTNISLWRRSGGLFVGTHWDDASENRGFITVTYTSI